MVGLLAPAVLSAQIVINEIHVEGNHRLKEAAIIAASGLRLNSDVSRADLDDAARRLVDTGLITLANYRSAPLGQGFSLTFDVTEQAATADVVLDIMGVDGQQIWSRLLGDTSLLDRVIPAQGPATEFYKRQIEAVLATSGHPVRLTTQDESDLATKKITVVFESAERPLIADIAFEGNAAISTKAIRDRIVKLTVGNAFSERDFRQILEANIRPMFEEKGLLQADFRSVRATTRTDGKASVTTTINDGRVWQLGKVDLDGEELPREKMLAAGKFASGKIANWTKFLSATDSMIAVLKRDGFVAPSVEAVRSFHAETGVVDVTIRVRKGRRSTSRRSG